jgi:hypothetical protein
MSPDKYYQQQAGKALQHVHARWPEIYFIRLAI